MIENYKWCDREKYIVLCEKTEKYLRLRVKKNAQGKRHLHQEPKDEHGLPMD